MTKFGLILSKAMQFLQYNEADNERLVNKQEKEEKTEKCKGNKSESGGGRILYPVIRKRKDPEKEELSIQARLEELEEEYPRGILYPKLSLSLRR